MATTKDKQKDEEKKLIDILKDDNQVSDLELHVDQCKINTEQESVTLRAEINKQKKIINGVYREENFSASKLYTERLKLELMEKKLDGLNAILKELFN